MGSLQNSYMAVTGGREVSPKGNWLVITRKAAQTTDVHEEECLKNELIGPNYGPIFICFFKNDEPILSNDR